MSNIARFNGFDNTFDELLRGFLVRPLRADTESATPAQFRVDVSENENGYLVHADIPGVKKEDIHVSIDGNQVQISAEVKNEKEVRDNNQRLLRAERYSGKLYRAFALEHDIDQDATQAKYADGVLELTLPKKASVAGKRITIQ